MPILHDFFFFFFNEIGINIAEFKNGILILA